MGSARQWAVVSTVALSSITAAANPPAALSCLQKHYPVKPLHRDGQWHVELPDGSTHLWDDGRQKTFEEKLATPDLQDTFSIRYRTGAVKPVTLANDDPGRIRFDPLFRAVYGHDAAEVEQHLVELTLHGQKLRVHARVKPAFERVFRRISALLVKDARPRPFLEGLGGTFNWRNIAGTDRLSAHSFGVSIDLNVKRSHYWEWQRPKAPLKWQNQVPQALVDAFEAEGFIWGGRWFHYDTMHFEYRPELLDPACQM